MTTGGKQWKGTIEPKTPGWLVQDPTTRPIGDLIPTIGGSGAHPWRGFFLVLVPLVWCLVLSAAFLRGNGVTLRTQKVIHGGDNGHVGRPCEVSPAPPCPELFCELRGLCHHSYFGPRTCVRSEKTKVIEVAGSQSGFPKKSFSPLMSTGVQFLAQRC